MQCLSIRAVLLHVDWLCQRAIFKLGQHVDRLSAVFLQVEWLSVAASRASAVTVLRHVDGPRAVILYLERLSCFLSLSAVLWHVDGPR